MARKNTISVISFLMLFSVANGAPLVPPDGWGAGSSIAPSGQTLYYIVRGDTAIVTYPAYWFSSIPYWGEYTKPSGALIIPDSVTFGGETYPVTSIGVSAFTYCYGLTSVVLPNTLTTIENSAFYGCTGISFVSFPDSIKMIDQYAFYACGIDTLILPEGIASIGEYAFSGCYNLSTLELPNGIETINRETFKNCNNLISVTIPEGIDRIEQEAFYGCSSLDSIVIPNSVTYIGWQAFKNCSNLSSVVMLSDTAPELYHNIYSGWGMDSVFGNNANDREFQIPCGSWDSYYNSWTCYRDELREPQSSLTMNVTVNDTTRGYVSATYHNSIVGCDSTTIVFATESQLFHFDHWSNGRTTNVDTLHLTGDSTVMAYFIGLSVSVNDSVWGTATHGKIGNHMERIYAMPNANYHFDHWSNGSTSNPDTLNLVGDSTIIAYFLPNRYHLIVNVNDANWGSISFPNGDTADYLDTLMIIAAPIEHYHVASWNGVSEVSASKDTTWVIMNYNRTITCNFAIDTHNVTAIANNNDRGVITGNGEYVYGTPCILTAIPYTGYVFKEWSNGIQTNPYAFQVTEDVELTAIFLSEDEVGINVINEDCVDVHSSNGRIVVEGTTEEVHVFDMVGRIVRNEALPNGVYIVKIGASPARKVVVMQ